MKEKNNRNIHLSSSHIQLRTMKVLLFLGLVGFSCAYAKPREDFITDEFINEINSKQSLWIAGKNFDDETTFEDFRKLLGVIPKDTAGYERRHYNVKADVPESFDAREQWPGCETINEIPDQSSCGSCWAVASTSSMSDRLCIHSNEKIKLRLSATNVLSCCEKCGWGCEGGFPIDAWSYWQEQGIVTGGFYNTSDGCQPYPFPTCDHYDSSPSYQDCPDDLYATPNCSSSCTTSANYKDSLTWGESSYFVEGEEDMLQEILNNGPIVAVYSIYQDFVAYKSGIYKHTSGYLLGLHAVRIIGWGVENDVKYWLIANSWNSGWGEQGFFRIIRGENDCGIEAEATAGMPKV